MLPSGSPPIRVLEHSSGYVSFLLWRRSYLCAIVQKRILDVIRPHFYSYGIDCIVQELGKAADVPKYFHEKDIELECLGCLTTMRVGRTHDIIELHDGDVYIMAWNTSYLQWCFGFFPLKPQVPVFSKIQMISGKIDAQLKH
jgi:hypothetical protein